MIVPGFYSMAMAGHSAAAGHSIVTAGAEQLLYSVFAGTLLAVGVWLVLQLFPKRDSRTSFVVWFTTLLATAALPGISMFSNAFSNSHAASSAARATASSIVPAPAMITVSSVWALVIFWIWAAVALAGVARVILAALQVRRLHTRATIVDLQTLDPGLRALIEEFQRVRPVSLLVSQQLEVPTAIGFFKPAIVLPAWMLEETPAEELKYTLLHELEHLRRRDDWTNLAQKMLKALLFFLPSVWWIEHRLSLDREMACDDAVLAHSPGPREYAECLAHIAQKSFLRRQLALAQAAVSRMRQLTVRVAKILDPNREHAKSLWKPAVPVVAVMAALCAFATSSAPSLIGFADPAGVGPGVAAQVAPTSTAKAADLSLASFDSKSFDSKSVDAKAFDSNPAVRAWDASFKPTRVPSQMTAKALPVKARRVAQKRRSAPAHDTTQVAVAAAVSAPDELNKLKAERASAQEQPEYVTVREEMFVVVTQRTTSSGQQSWQMQMSVWHFSIESPAPKPKTIPRKT